MLISWNVRGLNKSGKLKEISSHLHKLQAEIIVLIETKVKENKVPKIREKLQVKGTYFDNYKDHANGRIWLVWDNTKVELQYVKSSSQLLHCSVHDLAGNFKFWLTTVYAHKQIDKRKMLWKELGDINRIQQGPWCVIGDFNNVAKSQDRLGGKRVTEYEYVDFQDMLDHTGLNEMDNVGEFYTWSNKQSDNPIYSRIDRILANIEWLQDHGHATLTILPPHVSDHAILYLNVPDSVKRRKQFRFNNGWVHSNMYYEIVEQSWKKNIDGTPMYILWHKLKRLQTDLLKLNNFIADIQRQKEQARIDLKQAYVELSTDRMDGRQIEKVKQLTDKVIYWNEVDNKMLMQRIKIDWLRMGDDNTAYFHAYLKAKQNMNSMRMIQRQDGTVLKDQKDIANEVMQFYGSLMGQSCDILEKVDIDAMRRGNQLNMGQRELLLRPITTKEIKDALDGIGDLKSPGVDGYNSKFLKSCWHIVKPDVEGVVREFFEQDRLYKAFNHTTVTMVPKSATAKQVRDYRPIAGCTTF